MTTRLLLPILSLLFLVTSNWILWTARPLFIVSEPVQNPPPQSAVSIARTADDVARGIAAIQEELDDSQRRQLQPLFTQGFTLRSTVSHLQGKQRELSMSLLNDSTRLLEHSK